MDYTLYCECFPFSKIPFDNFITDALIGAYNKGWEIKYFEDVGTIPFSQTTMVVGSVESTQKYFIKHLGIEIEPVNYRDNLKAYMCRESKIVDIKDIKPPCFIKPNKIKAFTGFVITGNPLIDGNNIIENMTYGYSGDVIMEGIINVESEYRVYIQRGRIIGVKHYLGDPYLPLKKDFVESCLRQANNTLKHLDSYTLDFGVTSIGDTILIEANDAWAIGNYGLEPDVYFSFIKERWFQILRNKK